MPADCAIARKAAGSLMAMSDRILRSTLMLATVSAWINFEYEVPRSRHAALMRMIQRRRKSR